MEAIVNVVLPVFAIMAAGYLSGRAGILGQDSSQALNGFVYYAALPALFFGSLARTPLADVFYWDFIAVFGLGLLAIFFLAAIIARFAFPGGIEFNAMHGFSAIFSNTGYMGVPLLQLAFGQEGVLPAVITTIINGALVIVAGVVVLEVVRAQGQGALQVVRKAGAGVGKNPLFLSAAAGLLWSWGGLPLPASVGNFMDILGAAAGPCALFAIGLFMVGKSLRAGLGEVLWICLLKLVALPALVAWLALVVFELERVWAFSAIIQAALPIGALMFVLASSYEVYVQRATSAILLSTLLSLVTLSLLFLLLGV
ncbi:AEC family transporter [Aquibaculum arenosum]|uniref:AEC family transporter n=1 Tax=Aquibaculum arenosum TaxID=3032591 RepID=A0ABT5YME1_9PROT|nr:AEC family transporter [Fodinicurvata sp. CAU 1616]MDF2096029.1 AEC family transporter [Fodinicurvata sp. CAU 1616]